MNRPILDSVILYLADEKWGAFSAGVCVALAVIIILGVLTGGKEKEGGVRK